MLYSYEGIGSLVISCATGDDVSVGVPVKFSANDTVSACADEEIPVGVAVAIARDGSACSVQVGGFCSLPYSGSAPSLGFALLAADGDGGLKCVQSGGKSFLVAHVDSTAQTITIML